MFIQVFAGSPICIRGCYLYELVPASVRVVACAAAGNSVSQLVRVYRHLSREETEKRSQGDANLYLDPEMENFVFLDNEDKIEN